MSIIRKIFYKVNLKMKDGKVLPVTIATTDIQRIEPLVEKQKVFYLARGLEIVGLEIADTRYSFNMPEEQYQNELMFCDIIDDEGSDIVNPGSIRSYKLQ